MAVCHDLSGDAYVSEPRGWQGRTTTTRVRKHNQNRNGLLQSDKLQDGAVYPLDSVIVLKLWSRHLLCSWVRSATHWITIELKDSVSWPYANPNWPSFLPWQSIARVMLVTKEAKRSGGGERSEDGVSGCNLVCLYVRTITEVNKRLYFSFLLVNDPRM